MQPELFYCAVNNDNPIVTRTDTLQLARGTTQYFPPPFLLTLASTPLPVATLLPTAGATVAGAVGFARCVVAALWRAGLGGRGTLVPVRVDSYNAPSVTMETVRK